MRPTAILYNVLNFNWELLHMRTYSLLQDKQWDDSSLMWQLRRLIAGYHWEALHAESVHIQESSAQGKPGAQLTCRCSKLLFAAATIPANRSVKDRTFGSGSGSASTAAKNFVRQGLSRSSFAVGSGERELSKDRKRRRRTRRYRWSSALAESQSPLYPLLPSPLSSPRRSPRAP